MEKSRILITGVNGFVAKHFINYINQNDEFEVLGLDIGDNSDINSGNFRYKQANLCDYEGTKQIISEFKPDYILHLASVSSVAYSWHAPASSFINNTNIFLNIAESCRVLGLKTRILSVGSSEEYGNYDLDLMPLRENYELKPSNPYSIARVSQEMLSKLYADSYGLNIIMTRSFNHVGTGQKPDFFIPSIINQLKNIKNNKADKIICGNIWIIRDFLDVRDVVRAYYKLLKYGKSGEIYNVCSGTGYRLREIIKIASEILEINPTIETDKEKIRPDDNLVIIGDNSKLKTELGWSPEISLKQTLKDIIFEEKKMKKGAIR